jgi:hypothetical protein
MKALSVSQPWAWLIVQGHKDVENRSWPTTLRGRFLIHAPKGFDRVSYEGLSQTMELPPADQFERGGIVGAVDLVDCVRTHPSKWFSGPWGFVLSSPEVLPFRPLLGCLGFFDVPDGETVEP